MCIYCRRSRRWDSNPRRCDSLSQPSSTQPTATQEYSGGEAGRVWPGAYHTIPPFFISEWSLSALALHRCPPCLDPRSWPALTLTLLVLGPPWPSIVARLGSRSLSALACTILARLDLLWASTQKFQAGIVQYNQFAVDAGTSDTKCRRSRRWDSNPRRCDSLSQPSSTQPTAPQQYSGGKADRVWPGAYHTT